MSVRPGEYDEALSAALHHARTWLDGLGERPVPPTATAEEVAAALGGLDGPLPDEGADPAAVLDELVAAAEPGLMAMGSGRFFGWVIGGSLPAALGADVLVGAWDQNAGMRAAAPGVVGAEEVAGRWLLDLLGLPATADVGFATGATTANLACVLAARGAVLARAGWDVEARGLVGAPPLHVLAGAERHESMLLALRYAGLGAPQAVAADEQGRIRPDALRDALAALPPGEAVIVVLQAGHVHSGAFDPFEETIAAAHAAGAWVHVDGAFGLWAAAAPGLAHLTAGIAAADSWATDAHKTLNVPYDCGVAIVRDPAAVRAALSITASYLLLGEGPASPSEKVAEMSRRARGVPVWAALRSLGRHGVADLVGRLAGNARTLAEEISAIEDVEVLNDVVYTQVCFALGSDERTRALGTRLQAEGETWISGGRWRGRDMLRVSMSNWSTDEQDITRTVEAIRRAATT